MGNQQAKGNRGPAAAGKVGEILVSEGKISEDQLQQALDLQKDDSRNVGEILVSSGFVSPADLARALAHRLRLEYMDLSELGEEEVDIEAVNLLDEEACRKYMVLPLRFEDDRLVVAMSDPNDLYALEDLRILTGHRLAPVVVTREDLSGALDHLYSGPEEARGPGAGEDSNEAVVEAVGEPLREEPDEQPLALDAGRVGDDEGEVPEAVSAASGGAEPGRRERPGGGRGGTAGPHRAAG